MSNQQKEVHDEKTRLISLKPHLIGLENIILSTTEVNLFNKRGVLLRQPDNLMFSLTNKTIYDIEYKTHDSLKQYIRAKKQLTTSKDYLSPLFKGWNIINLYIHDDYDVEIC